MDAQVHIFMERKESPVKFFMHAKTEEDLYRQLPKFMQDKYGRVFHVEIDPITDAKPFAEIHFNRDNKPVASVGYECPLYSPSLMGKAIYTNFVCNNGEAFFEVLAKIYRVMIDEYDKNDLFYAKIKTGKG